MPEDLPTHAGVEWHAGRPYHRWSDGRLLPVVRGGDGTEDGEGGGAGDGGGDGNDEAADETDTELGEKGKRALAAERDARAKAERDRKAAEKRAKDLEDRLAKIEGESKSEHEKAVEAARREAADAARTEMTAELHAERIEAALIRAASGKLADPHDAVRFLKETIEVGDDGRPDSKAVASAIEQLLKDKPYLAPSTATNGRGSADQGTRKNGRQKPATLTDAIAGHYAAGT